MGYHYPISQESWGNRIRTCNSWVKAKCVTITPYPNRKNIVATIVYIWYSLLFRIFTHITIYRANRKISLNQRELPFSFLPYESQRDSPKPIWDWYPQPSPISFRIIHRTFFYLILFALSYKQFLLMLYSVFLQYHGKLTYLDFLQFLWFPRQRLIGFFSPFEWASITLAISRLH